MDASTEAFFFVGIWQVIFDTTGEQFCFNQHLFLLEPVFSRDVSIFFIFAGIGESIFDAACEKFCFK